MVHVIGADEALETAEQIEEYILDMVRIGVAIGDAIKIAAHEGFGG